MKRNETKRKKIICSKVLISSKYKSLNSDRVYKENESKQEALFRIAWHLSVWIELDFKSVAFFLRWKRKIPIERISVAIFKRVIFWLVFNRRARINSIRIEREGEKKRRRVEHFRWWYAVCLCVFWMVVTSESERSLTFALLTEVAHVKTISAEFW